MSQETLGTVDAVNTTGTTLAALLTDWGKALESTHKGPAEPAYKKAGLFWLDDDADPVWTLKFYSGTGWLSVLSIDTGAGGISLTGSSSELGGITAGQFLRSDADTFMQAALEARYGIHGGFGVGGNGGSGDDWAAPMWALGKPYDGAGYGSSFDPGSQYHGTVWIRAGHSAALPGVGEGIYIYRNGSVVAAFGQYGTYFPDNAISPSAINGAGQTEWIYEPFEPTAVSSIQMVWDPDKYISVKLIGEGVSNNENDRYLGVRAGYNSGGNFFGSVGHYVDQDGATDNRAVITKNNVNTSYGVSFELDCIGFSSTRTKPQMVVNSVYRRHSSQNYMDHAQFFVDDDLAEDNKMDALNLIWSAGNFRTVGKIGLLGTKRAA